MKKILLALFSTTASAIGFAQSINFGIKGGLNLSELYRAEDGVFFNDSFTTGFNLGGIVNIDFQNFSIQPGIFYSTKGEKATLTLPTANFNITTTTAYNTKMNYIEMPVNFLYNVKISPEIDMHLGGGPYLGYGVSETITMGNTIFPNNGHKFADKNPDYGINVIAGIDIKNKFIVDLSYGLGVANISYLATMENRLMSLSVGYLFR